MGIMSCRKDPTLMEQTAPCDTTYNKTYTFDTIYPSDYLMTYPGSWWEYDNGDRVDCVEWDYTPIYKQVISENGCPLIESNYAYYPRLTGTNYSYISENSYLDTNQHPFHTSAFSLILEPGIKQEYRCSSTSEYVIKIWKELHESFDSLEVNGVLYYDVIDVRTQSQTSYYELAGGGPTNYTHHYYAKEIGLIQSIQYFNAGADETGSMMQKSITDFYIAPH